MKARCLAGWLLLLGAAACGRDPLLDPAAVARGGAPGSGGVGGNTGIDARGRGGSAADTAAPDVQTDVQPGRFALHVLPSTRAPLPVGKSLRLRALVELDGLWRDLGSDPDLSWSNDRPDVAEVAAKSGRVTGLAPGRTLVRATHPLFSMATVEVEVTASALVRVAIAPAPLTLALGQTRQLTAQASFADGSQVDISNAAVWASGDQRIARVQNSTPPLGELVGVLAGETTVTAEFAGTTGSARVTVTGMGTAMFSLAPSMATRTVGESVRFTAQLQQPSGAVVDVSNLTTWSSSLGGVANALGGGQFRCQSMGTAMVRGSYMSFTATASLSCSSAGPVLRELRLDLSANSPFPVGSPYRIDLFGVYSNGTEMRVRASAIRWMVSDPAVAEVALVGDANNLVGLSPGSTLVTASYDGLSTSQTYTFFMR